jgi:hypothetical protein
MDDTRKFEGALQRAVEVHSYAPTALLWRFEIAPIQDIGAITELDRVPTLHGLEAWETDIATFLTPFEECRQRTMEPLHHLICDHCRNVGIGRLVVMLVLLIQVKILPSRLKMCLPLRKRIIIQLARGFQRREECGLLGSIGSHTILKCAFHVEEYTKIDYIVNS